MEKLKDSYEVGFDPDENTMIIDQSGEIHYSLGFHFHDNTVDEEISKSHIFYTLKGYKRMCRIPILTSNHSDAKNITSYYPDSPVIKIIKKESFRSGTYDNIYKGYPEEILTEYFSPLIHDIKNEEYLTWKQKNDLNEKFSKTRKLVSKFYRILKNGMHTNLDCSLSELFNHTIKDKKFMILYENWRNSNYNQDSEPSVVIRDRNSSSINGFELCTVKDNKLYGRSARKIGQYTLDGELVKVYPSIVEAVKNTECTKSGICKVLYGDRKSHKGYFWKHE
ncbi:hypothetical protein [Carboxylicivirga sp. N1Y90]|uniref:hypothetical protein n=1 Tax=Carboxylicivirga fragile TaxID=3417571 RepID=UPI003D330A87|nr:hypothetical protein [Marinilabiliaceae bacterium N1Y90]